MIDKEFTSRNRKIINKMDKDIELKKLSQKWFDKSFEHEYSYHFTWLGLPIIQYPQDIIALQEIIWKIKPDLIIETGIARGGSLIFYASMLELLQKGEVIGIDIDIRKHNKKAIESHPLNKRITMIEGSSIKKDIIKKVFKLSQNKKKILVILDSFHTHSHVLKELEAYSELVSKGGCIVVFDTVVEDMPKNSFPNKPWSIGNNPKTAVKEFLTKNNRFKIDKTIEKEILITSCKNGFLKCVKNIS